MPTLHWIGKEKVINHHLDIPYHTLNKEYDFNHPDSDTKENKNGENPFNPSNPVNPRSDNKIIHADNLLALKSLLPEYEGRIKCIYIDPPYNTGNEGWVYNDNVSDPRFKKWLGKVVGKEAEDLTRHDKWLCMMYPRLKLLHKLLSEDGAIFISIDDNEQASLKMMMDEIWGAGNFVTQLIWKKKGGVSNTEKLIGKVTEFVSLYTKDIKKFTPNRKTIDKKFPLQDEFGSYVLEGLLKTDEGEYKRDTMKYGIYDELNNQLLFPPSGKRWIIGEQKKDELLKQKLLIFGKDKNGIPNVKLKKYDNNSSSVVYYNLLEELGSLSVAKNELNALGFNREDFGTPKPVSLIEVILQLSSTKNSIILDSFAGSGTTAHSILNLNKQDGGNRKFILIEMEEYAETITAERVKRVINGYGDTEGTGGSFSFYTLGERVLDDEQNLNPNLSKEKIHSYIWYSETHQPYTLQANAAGYLGKCNNTGYYFNYQPNQVTTLDDAYLTNVTQLCEQYVMYADVCLLSEKTMLQHNIIFKKIPRDISKL